jgi:hypothetical protein
MLSIEQIYQANGQCKRYAFMRGHFRKTPAGNIYYPSQFTSRIPENNSTVDETDDHERR